MPFKPIETAKCPVCTKSVYAAEEKVAGGYKYHKGCFKCGLCGKFLDSTTVSEHEAQLYCKNCHARKYGPKGYGFGGGAGCLSMDSGAHLGGEENGYSNGNGAHEFKVIKAPEGEGCPRCGGYVYAAEQMLARGRAFHKKCFKCGDCGKGLDSTNCCEGPDKEIYCKVDYARKFGPKGYGYGKGAGALQMTHENGEHASHRVMVDTSVIQAAEGEGCPRCGGVVYAAELVLSKGREWHRKCYKCRDCTKTLDSIIACDGPDKDVYCKTCYGKKFGPHGYGYACGSGFLQTDLLTEEDFVSMRPCPPPSTTSIMCKEGQEGCPRCGGVVFAAEQMLAKGTVWHKKCFNCNECHRPLDSVLACDGPDKEIHCKPCYGKLFGPRGYGYGHTPTLSINGESIQLHDDLPSKGRKAKEGGCPRCGFAVYAAEQMIAKGRNWHKRCFSCNSCNRSLDSTNLCDSPTGEIFCRSCYGREFGPKGFGFGMGAGTLTMNAS